MTNSVDILSVILYFYLVTGFYVAGLVLIYLWDGMTFLERLSTFFGHTAIWPLTVAQLARDCLERPDSKE